MCAKRVLGGVILSYLTKACSASISDGIDVSVSLNFRRPQARKDLDVLRAREKLSVVTNWTGSVVEPVSTRTF